MKAVIIGKIASGKTTYLINNIIPLIGKFVFFDFLREHGPSSKIRESLKRFEGGLTGSELKNQVIEFIRIINNDKTIIIDNAELLYFPSSDNKGFEWLKKELANKKYILVFCSIATMSSRNISDIFDNIYLFPTNDNSLVVDSYIDWQTAKGTIIHHCNKI